MAGLGYAGRTSVDMRAGHVPVGVARMGVRRWRRCSPANASGTVESPDRTQQELIITTPIQFYHLPMQQLVLGGMAEMASSFFLSVFQRSVGVITLRRETFLEVLHDSRATREALVVVVFCGLLGGPGFPDQ